MILNSHGVNRHARATIDLDVIRYNYQLLKQMAGGNNLIAVVKADAYGHGSIEVARALPMADAFAVAAVGEAVALREAGISQKIIVMGGFIRTEELKLCIDHGLDPVIHHQTHLEHLSDQSNLNQLQVWIKVDSGMGRLGYPLKQVSHVINTLDNLPGLGQIRMMTHFASADDVDNDFTDKQLETIKQLQLDDYEWSISNSAGILGWPQSYRRWVRAGIAMYGANPMSDRKRNPKGLKSAMSMKTSVLAVNQHRRGDLIGYGCTYICPQDTTIAVIAAGYADGYPRLKTDAARVNINGELCDIVGRVSMDMITVDVSHLKSVQVDDEVLLFGEYPEANEIADSSETIAYEIFCNVGAHVKREYINID